MILDANQIAAIRQSNDEDLRCGRFETPCASAQTIQNLLHTIEALKKEKRKWKKVAQHRGKLLADIAVLSSDIDK